MFQEHNNEIKLIDFGLATFYAKNIDLDNKSGTFYYMAPEIFDRKYTEKADNWSCGVVMY
jgi:serine/threonine protein kinase